MSSVLEDAVWLKPEELFTLASLLGGETLIGIPDPFPGWLTEEIQEAMSAAQDELIQKGYLGMVDGRLQMDAVVAALIGTLIKPQAVLMLILSQANREPQQTCIYHRPPFFVHLHPQQEGYALWPLLAGEITPLLRQHISLGEVDAASGEPFSLLEADLMAVREAFHDGRPADAQQILRRAGVSEESASAFLSAWQTGRRNGSLVCMTQRNGWQVNGLGFLEGENGLWRMRVYRSAAQDWVECLPCSAAQLWQEVDKLLIYYFFE
jgi:hypothetical protein